MGYNAREEIVRAATEFAIERTGDNTCKKQVYAYIRVILLTCPEKNVKIKKLFLQTEKYKRGIYSDKRNCDTCRGR